MSVDFLSHFWNDVSIIWNMSPVLDIALIKLLFNSSMFNSLCIKSTQCTILNQVILRA